MQRFTFSCIAPGPRSTHPSPGPLWPCAFPWQRPVTISVCPGPFCSTTHTQTPEWTRFVDVARSSRWPPGPSPAHRADPTPPSGPCSNVHGSVAGLAATHLFCRRRAGGQTGRSCAAAFCHSGQFESAPQSGSALSWAPKCQAPATGLQITPSYTTDSNVDLEAEVKGIHIHLPVENRDLPVSNGVDAF